MNSHWFGRQKIAVKLTIALISVAILPLLIYGIFSYFFYVNSIRGLVVKNLVSIASDKIEVIRTYVDEKEADVKVLARTPVVLRSMPRLNEVGKMYGYESDAYKSAEGEARRFLTYYEKSADYHDILLIDPEGNVVFSILHEDDFGTNLMDGPYHNSELAWAFNRSRMSMSVEVSKFRYYSPSEDMAAFITAPIFDGKNFLGICAVQLKNGILRSFIEDYSGLGETGEIEIGDRIEGDVTFVMPTRHLMKSGTKNESDRSPLGDMAFMERATSGARGVGVGLDYRGKEVVAVWRFLPQLRWGIVVKQDVSEAFEPVYVARSGAFLVGIATIFVAIFLARAIGLTFSRPLVDLTTAARDMIPEGADIFEENEKLDELQQLSISFRTMFLKLSEFHTDLEKKISERTGELEAALSEKDENVKELRKAQDAMLLMVEDLNRQAKNLRDAQNTIARSERLSAIGKLASSVAHELRNPLGVMKNVVYYLNMLGEEKVTPEIRKHLDILSNEIDGSSKIISDLLDFARIRTPKLQLANVNDVVADALRRMDVYPGVEIETEIEESLPELHIDADQIRQVFSNLAVNACQAMPDGGRLNVTTAMSDGYAVIKFRDTGVGISEDDMDEIFEPLFTTKTKGTGLGLSICASIVEGHHGRTEVESEAGNGTTFIVRLPITNNIYADGKGEG